MLPLLVSAGAAIATGGLTAYGAMTPRSQLFGRTFCAGTDDRQIALTYDDGPSEHTTLRLLEVLAQHSAKATFFMIGKYVKLLPHIAREIASQGHVLGNHTFSHPSLFWTSPRMVRQELEQCQKAIEDATGQTPVYFRPPFGARRPDVLRTARALKLIPVMWTATCFDWSPNDAEDVYTRATRDIEKKGFGSVVLLHDGGHLAMDADRSHTVKATELLLKKYRLKGYQFTGVDGMKW
jgi:peptidoglycan/xylan/chitin deacetylase (PgdA/CDA1 family)